MQVQTIKNNNYTNFGMAIKTSSKANRILERDLTTNAAKQLKELVNAEKSNPTNVNLTTEKRYISGPYLTNYWTAYDNLLIKVEDKKFRRNIFMSIFSQSRATIAAIKRAVNYVRTLTQKRELMNNIDK